MNIRMRKSHDALTNIGSSTVDHLKRSFVQDDKVASRELFYSTEFEVNGLTLNVYSAAHFQFVEHGRAAGGKMPPSQPIEQWIKNKGLSDVLNTYLVQRSIQQKGIKPKFYLRDWLNSNQVKWQNVIGNAIFIDFTDELDKSLKEAKQKMK